MNKCLENVNVAFIYYDKLKSIMISIEKLIKNYKNLDKIYDKIYKIYFNN